MAITSKCSYTGVSHIYRNSNAKGVVNDIHIPVPPPPSPSPSSNFPLTNFRTLQWVRQDAPIIIHVNLDHALRFLVEDTHYRNLFEVGTGGGSTDFSARKSWEVISFIPRHFYPDGCHLQYASATNDKCLPWGDKTWLQG